MNAPSILVGTVNIGAINNSLSKSTQSIINDSTVDSINNSETNEDNTMNFNVDGFSGRAGFYNSLANISKMLTNCIFDDVPISMKHE